MEIGVFVARNKANIASSKYKTHGSSFLRVMIVEADDLMPTRKKVHGVNVPSSNSLNQLVFPAKNV